MILKEKLKRKVEKKYKHITRIEYPYLVNLKNEIEK